MSLYVIEHDGDLSIMPPNWNIHRASLSRKAGHLYELLRQSKYAESDKPLSDRTLAAQAGLSSRTALYQTLQELELVRFLGLFEDAGMIYVTVSSPPPLTEADERAFETIGEEEKVNENGAARRLAFNWKSQWTKSFGEGYELSAVDHHMMRRLCHNEPDWKTIRAVMDYYWKYANEGEHKGLATFCSEFPEWLASKVTFEENLH